MGKRFNRLDYALKSLRTPTGTGTTPDAPTGSILANYQEVASGKKTLSYPRAEASKPGNILQVSVLPFFFGGTTGSEAIVSFSKRVSDETTLDTVESACNHIVVDVDAHQEVKGFFPAQATVAVFDGTDSNKTSQITGVPYNSKDRKSYTFPYGASATEKAEGNVRKDILTAVNALANASVSFSSEKV